MQCLVFTKGGPLESGLVGLFDLDDVWFIFKLYPHDVCPSLAIGRLCANEAATISHLRIYLCICPLIGQSRPAQALFTYKVKY